MNKTIESTVLAPRDDVFSAKQMVQSTFLRKGTRFPIYEKTEYPPEGGIYVFYKGHPYPKKGFPFPAAVQAADVMKRITRTAIEAISGKEMILPALGFMLLPWKFKVKVFERVTANYVRVGTWILNDYFLVKKRYSIPVQEMRSFVYTFMSEMGITNLNPDWQEVEGPDRKYRMTAWKFARIIATIIEYDDAYRLRIQDLMSEIGTHALRDDPRAELKRLSEIFIKREKTQAAKFINTFIKVLRIALLHPRIKKAFIKAVRHTDFNRMILDNADRYHILLRNDYDFTGRTFEQRKKIYIDFFTKSVCCNGDVFESEPGNQQCKKCWKKCEFTQKFPPESEIV